MEKGIDLAANDKLHRPEWETYLAHAHASKGNLHKAWSVLDNLRKSECNFIPASMSDLIQLSTRHPEFLHRGLGLFQDVQRAGTELGTGVYSDVVRAMRRVGELDKLLTLLSEIRAQGLRLDAATYHNVLEGLGRAGVSRARDVLQEVRLHGVVSDYIAFNKLIGVCIPPIVLFT